MARFESEPRLRQMFLDDYRRATILLVNRWGDNPQGYGIQSVGSSSVTYPAGSPREVAALMQRWAPAPRLRR